MSLENKLNWKGYCQQQYPANTGPSISLLDILNVSVTIHRYGIFVRDVTDLVTNRISCMNSSNSWPLCLLGIIIIVSFFFILSFMLFVVVKKQVWVRYKKEMSCRKRSVSKLMYCFLWLFLLNDVRLQGWQKDRKLNSKKNENKCLPWNLQNQRQHFRSQPYSPQIWWITRANSHGCNSLPSYCVSSS